MVAFNTPLTRPKDYCFGSGEIFFAPFDANGVPKGARSLGNVPEFTLSVAIERVEHFSSRTAIRKKDLSKVISVDFAGSITFDEFSDENQALFLAGSIATITQAATPVTNERILNAQNDLHYQLGIPINETGVRDVTSVTIGLYELVNAVARVDSTAYAVGDIYKVTAGVYLVTTAGTSAGSVPTMVTSSIGASTTDGTATVKYLGTTGNFTLTTDYILSAGSARIGIVDGGNIGLACDLYESVVPGSYLSINANYTPTAGTRTQISTSGAAAIDGRLHFISDNAEGKNRDVVIPSCSLGPEGDFPFITGTEIASATLSIGVNERDTSTPQILVDGRPLS